MDARQYALMPDPFPMWRGGALHGARISYETWGKLNARRDNAVLLFTGLSPSAHAAASPEDPSEGWWPGMVGPKAALDSDGTREDTLDPRLEQVLLAVAEKRTAAT